MSKAFYFLDPKYGPTGCGPDGKVGSAPGDVIPYSGSIETSEAEARHFPTLESLVGRPPRPEGRKDDGGKLDVTLFFDDLPHAIEAVTEVLQWAITKKQPTPYRRGSWQGVDNFQQRYRAAQLRHMLDSAKEAKMIDTPAHLTRDKETELLQLAHNATDAMFQLEMACRDLKRAKGQAEQEVS